MIKIDGLHQQLSDLLRHEVGANVELLQFELFKEYSDYLVIRAQLRHPTLDVCIKLAGPKASYPCQFDQTAAIYHLVGHQCDLPTPEVISANVSYQQWPWRYFIQTFLPGEVWASSRARMDVDEISSAYRQIGEAVAKIHSLHLPAYGEIALDCSVIANHPYFEALKERARLRITDPYLYQFFLNVLLANERLFAEVDSPCLCHEDLHSYNLLFQQVRDQWVLSGVLDFDKAWSGHHETDLARLEFWRGMTDREFWEAYQNVITISPMYQQRKLIYQLFWCLEYAQPTVEHIEDTRKVCDQLAVSFPGFNKMEHFRRINRR